MRLDQYDEFENYLNSIRDAEFSSLVLKIDTPAWSICHIDLDEVHIQYGKEDSGHIASGNIRADGWVFFLILSGQPARADGLSLEEGAAFIIPPGHNFHLSTKKPHEWLSIFIPSKLIVNSQKNNHSHISRTNQIVSLDPKNLKHFLYRLRTYHSSTTAFAVGHKVKTQKLINLITKLANHLIFSPESKKPSLGRKIIDRNDIITEALCEIHNNKKAVGLNIETLLDVTDVSERTLRTVFHEFFGISPLNYINLTRLHETKSMILNPKNSNKTISFISSSVGFFDQGRFAKNYHSLFGELPSETLLRTKKNAS